MVTSKLARKFIHVFLIVFGVIWIYPFVWMILSSFKKNSNFLVSGFNPIPEHFQWENYLRAWNDANFAGYFANTVIMTVATVLIVILLCALTGYPLGRVAFPGRKIIIVCIAAIMFIPKGYTIIPLYELVDQLGLANSLAGLIIAESSGAHVLFILLFASFFSNIPKELEEAATIDGCGYLRTFFNVMLPMVKPMVATAAIMQFIWSWGSFLIPLVLTLEDPSLRTLAVGMQAFIGEHATDWSGMSAGATISLLPVMIVFMVMQRYFIEGVAGAVKQ